MTGEQHEAVAWAFHQAGLKALAASRQARRSHTDTGRSQCRTDARRYQCIAAALQSLLLTAVQPTGE